MPSQGVIHLVRDGFRVNTDVPAPMTATSRPAPSFRLWQWLVAAFREVEGTRLGGVLLGNVWPAYVFALPLAARVIGFLHNHYDSSLHAQAAYVQELVTIVFL